MGGVGVTELRNRRRAILVALALAGPTTLAGCSSVPSMPSFSSLFGSSSSATDGNAANASAAGVQPVNFDCPEVTVRQGAATLTSSTDAADPTALNLKYQVSISTTARECKLIGNTVSIKVGMQGRVISPQVFLTSF